MSRMLVSQIRYQLTLLIRTPRSFILGILMPALLLALEVGKHHKGSTLLTGVVAGLTVFSTLSIAYLAYAGGLVVTREEGVLRRWRATPLPAWCYFAGRITAAILTADASALVLLLAGTSMAGLHLTAGAVASLLVAVTLGAVALASAGTAITPLLPSAQAASAVLALTYIPLLIFAGGFGSVQGEPRWLATTMTYFPVQPVVDAATHAIEDSSLMPVRDLIVLAAWTAGCLLLSVRYFRWDPTRPAHARRAGPGNHGSL